MLEWLRRGRPGSLLKFAPALLDKGREPGRPIIGNFDVWRGASNAHRRYGRVDLHLAALCDLARHEGERSLAQAERCRVGLPIWLIHEFVQSHLGVAGYVEGGTIGEVDPDPAIGSGPHHVAPVDEITNFGLTGLTGDIRLNDHRIGAFDCDRAGSRDDFPNGF